MRALAATLVALFFGGCGGRSAWAEDAPPSPEAAAAAVKAAHDAADGAKVAEWALKDAPDPWLVADALLASGAREAAEAFAKAAPRKDVERLPELVVLWKATDGDTAARVALAAGNAALLAQKPADALAAFDAAQGDASPVLALRLVHGRGLALMRLERLAEAASRFGEVATRAEKLGWLSRTALALIELAWAEHDLKHLEPALAVAHRLLALQTLRGIPARTAEAYLLLGHHESARGDIDAAIVALQQALSLFESVGDGAAAGRTLNSMADFLLRKRDFVGAERELARALGKVEPLGLWPEVARSHVLRARIQVAQRQLPTWATLAIASYESALEAAQKAGDAERTAAVVFELGKIHGDRDGEGDQAKALELHLRAHAMYERLGNRQGVGATLVNAADSNMRLGHDDAAQGQADRVVALARELGAAWLEGRGLQILGELAERRTKPEEALAAYTAAVARFEAVGDRVEAARASAGAADARRLLGDLPKAREQADRAQQEGEALRDRGVVAYALLVGTRIRKDQGLREEALAFARLARDAYQSIKSAPGVAALDALVKELEAATPR